MRTVPTLLVAAVLAVGATACGDPGDIEGTVDEAVEGASDLATDVADAAEDAASEAADAASEAGERVSEAADLAGFCAAAYRVQDAIEDDDWDAAIDAGEDLVAEAPDDIRPQAETVLAGAEAYRDGDEQAVTEEDFRTATEELRTYTADVCDPRE